MFPYDKIAHLEINESVYRGWEIGLNRYSRDFKLPVALKQQWIEALRSGKYKQGKGSLRIRASNNEYLWCCLGVYGDCLKGRKWKIKDVNADGVGDYDFEYLDYTSYGDFLSYELIPGDIQRILAAMNDFRVPFELIAQVIEEYL